MIFFLLDETGNDLNYIGLYVTEEGLKNARNLGYKVTKTNSNLNGINYDYSILGPDEIVHRCLVVSKLLQEPFIVVSLNVENVERSFNYWVGQLNMHEIFYKNNILRCDYNTQVPMEFVQLRQNTSRNLKAIFV